MYFIKCQILLSDEGDDPMQLHIKQQFHYSMKQKVTVFHSHYFETKIERKLTLEFTWQLPPLISSLMTSQSPALAAFSSRSVISMDAMILSPIFSVIHK